MTASAKYDCSFPRPKKRKMFRRFLNLVRLLVASFKNQIGHGEAKVLQFLKPHGEPQCAQHDLLKSCIHAAPDFKCD